MNQEKKDKEKSSNVKTNRRDMLRMGIVGGTALALGNVSSVLGGTKRTRKTLVATGIEGFKRPATPEDMANTLISILETLREEVSGTGPQSDSLLASGKIAEYYQSFAEAGDYYQSASDNGSREAVARLALIHLKTGKVDTGLTLANTLASENPKFTFTSLGGDIVSAMTVLGDACLMNGMREDAITAYTEAIRLVPGDSYSTTQLATLLIQGGRFAEAAKLESNLSPNPRSERVRSLIRLSNNNSNKQPRLMSLEEDPIPNVPV